VKHELKESIGVLLLFVHDFPRMLAFYCHKLGLPVSKIHPGKWYEPLSSILLGKIRI
jgi:catechol 2,3-dioxygenase-like lactoylglutathione lyase family enzyme